MATLITNGYLLTRPVIEKLDAAWLDSLQISIDNVRPDDVSKKSLKVLDQKLRLLAERAAFEVVVNTVVGGGIPDPEDALVIARRARELGFRSTSAPTGGQDPFAGVIATSSTPTTPIFTHRSLAAATTIGPVDLGARQGAAVAFILQARDTGYEEEEDALEVRATDGTGATQTDTRTPPAPDGARGWHQILFFAQ